MSEIKTKLHKMTENIFQLQTPKKLFNCCCSTSRLHLLYIHTCCRATSHLHMGDLSHLSLL